MTMDQMQITVLEDGNLKIEMDQISPQNHMTAEAFLRNVAQACGGPSERKQKQGMIGHAHQHRLGLGHTH